MSEQVLDHGKKVVDDRNEVLAHFEQVVSAFDPELYAFFRDVYFVSVQAAKDRSTQPEVGNEHKLDRLAVLDVQTTAQAYAAAIELPETHVGREYIILTARMHLIHALEKVMRTVTEFRW